MLYRPLLIFSLLVSACVANAGLKAMDDDELSSHVGQAFIQFDRTENVNGYDFTKISFGLDVETSLNADLVELGNYRRDGADGADIRIRDFALGSVNDNGTINPFKIQDPFLEVAFDRSGGAQNVVGVRFGFGGAEGQLSGAIDSLTGNIEVVVEGTAAPIRREAGKGFFGPGRVALLTLAGVSDSTRLRSDAQLVDAAGNPNQVRSNLVGIPNGGELGCVTGCNLGGLSDFLLGLFGSNGCSVLGIGTCFPLSSFRTLDIGSPGSLAQGMFLSFQTEAITWRDGNVNTPTVSGAFINIPNGGITVDFEQSFGGIERVRTKLLDPYFD